MNSNIVGCIAGPENVIIRRKQTFITIAKMTDIFVNVMPDITPAQFLWDRVSLIHARRATPGRIPRRMRILALAVMTIHTILPHLAHCVKQAHTMTKAPAHHAPHAQTRPITRTMLARAPVLQIVPGNATRDITKHLTIPVRRYATRESPHCMLAAYQYHYTNHEIPHHHLI